MRGRTDSWQLRVVAVRIDTKPLQVGDVLRLESAWRGEHDMTHMAAEGQASGGAGRGRTRGRGKGVVVVR